MPISICEDEAGNDVFTLRFIGYWTWDEYFSLEPTFFTPPDNGQKRVDFILDITHAATILPPGGFVHISTMMNRYSANLNWGLCAVVNALPFGRRSTEMMLQILGMRHPGIKQHFRLADSIENAEAIIWMDRFHSLQSPFEQIPGRFSSMLRE